MSQASRAEQFDAAYAGGTPPPWDIGRPQPALQRLADAGKVRGNVLDIGCGTGEHALMAAALGLSATGVDIAPNAIAAAQRKAAERDLPARFLVWDVLDLGRLGERFDVVLDCGLFHILGDDERPRFAAGLASVTRVGGRYFMLCFSDRQPGSAGPRRISQDEIRASFTDGWQVESIEPAILEITIATPGALGWLATIDRV